MKANFIVFLMLTSNLWAQDNNLFMVVHAQSQTSHRAGWVITNLLSETHSATVLAGKNFKLNAPHSWVEPLAGFDYSRQSQKPVVGFKMYWEIRPWVHTWIESNFTDPLKAPGLGRGSFVMFNSPVPILGKLGVEIVSGVGTTTYGWQVLMPLSDNFVLVSHFRERGVISVDAFFDF